MAIDHIPTPVMNNSLWVQKRFFIQIEYLYYETFCRKTISFVIVFLNCLLNLLQIRNYCMSTCMKCFKIQHLLIKYIPEGLSRSTLLFKTYMNASFLTYFVRDIIIHLSWHNNAYKYNRWSVVRGVMLWPLNSIFKNMAFVSIAITLILKFKSTVSPLCWK